MSLPQLGPVIRRLASAGRDVLFPAQCAGCRVPLIPAASRSSLRLCDHCRSGLAGTEGPVCDRCSASVGPYLDTREGCIHCREEHWAFDRVLALGPYEEPLRATVLRMKRPGGEPMAAALAELLIERRGRELSGLNPDAVIPAPHHWSNRVTQFHLAPMTLARFLGAALERPVLHNVVRKLRRTPPQSQLTATARRRNLTGAFGLSGRPRLAGLSILIVDDVLTTGQTAHRVAKALREAGARAVNVAVIARASR